MTTMIRILRDFKPILNLDLYGEHMPKERITGSQIDLDLSASTYARVYMELLAYKFHPHKCSPEIEIYKNISPNKPKADHLFSTPLKEESGDRLERTKSGSLDGQLPSPVHSVSMPLLHPSIDPEDGQTGHVFNDSEADSSSLSEGEFKLEWQRTFPDPVLAMDVLDITGDGLNEIIVVSQKGVHILQHKLPEVAKLCMERLQQAQAMLQQNIEDDAFQQLLTENIDVS